MRKMYVFLAISLVLCGACSHFLEESSPDLVYARTCSDLNEILIGNGYMKCGKHTRLAAEPYLTDVYFPYLHVMDDDIWEYAVGKSTKGVAFTYRNFYTWSDQVNIDYLTGKKLTDTDWGRLYEHIGYLNVIIAYADKFMRDSASVRDRVMGEARFLRGAYYYYLVNISANPYSPGTASKEMGVPLNLTEKIEDKYYERADLKTCYQQIVEDLKVASDRLEGVSSSSIYRADEAAARTLLARVYLYMGEWQSVLDECNKILKLKDVALYDLNGFDTGYEDSGSDYIRKEYMLRASNPEILFTSGSANASFLMGESMLGSLKAYTVSEELRDLYMKYAPEGVEDLRVNCYLLPSKWDPTRYRVLKSTTDQTSIDVFDCFVIRSAEVYLNKAEAEAMLEREGDAVLSVKVLLENRFKDHRVPDVGGLHGESLVRFIREERRRELCFESQRWFDLRRYAVSSKYPEKKEIEHRVYEAGAVDGSFGVFTGTYVLKPYGEDPAWVMPIPADEIVYNKGNLIDNPKRVARKFK